MLSAESYGDRAQTCFSPLGRRMGSGGSWPKKSLGTPPPGGHFMHVGMTTFFQNIGHAMSDAAVYTHEMSMADLAEPLGFDSLWSAEHHFDDYTMCPNVTQFLT